MTQQDFGAFVAHAAQGPPANHAATGPLAGLSFVVKDLIDVAGFVTRGGNPDWARGRAPAAAHADSVRRLLAAGAHFLGKTHTDELSRGIFGETSQDGMPLNPRAPGHVPGGSSSGSAVAVAAGLADIGLGSDTGGSVRAPASFCGLCGLRPTHGRVSFNGALHQAPSFDTLGWLTRDGTTLARAGAVLLDPAPVPAAPRRLVVATDLLALAEPATAAAFRAALPRLAPHAPPLTEAAFSPIVPVGDWFAQQSVLQSAEAWESFAEWIDRSNPRFTWEVAQSFAAGARVTAAEREAATAFRTARRAETEAIFAAGEVLYVFPATPFPAPPIGLRRSESWALRNRLARLTCPAGLLGLPQLVLPLAMVDGRPLGLALLGAPGSDAALLALAAQILPAE